MSNQRICFPGKLRICLQFFLAATGWTQHAKANNLQITNVSVTAQNLHLHYSMIRFDISWENSWRISSGPSNWDAAWVFIKYRIQTQPTWKHATLNWVNGTGAADGHVVPSGAAISSGNDNGGGGSYGVFIYHNSNMVQGNISYTGAELRWNYGNDGVSDRDSVELCVMGIEMVMVPQSAFSAGDGTTGNVAGQFHDASGVTNPFQISSENAITLGGGNPGSMGNNDGYNMQLGGDDFNNQVSKSLPAAFPKGYRAFYCMKYEITQEQYVSFLNKLSYNEQLTRTNQNTPPDSPAGTNVLTFFGTPFRNGVVIKTPGIAPSSPALYACDGNANGTCNEPDDGHNVACNNISWADVTAYLDWVALRPMTELEFEKACRGTMPPVAEENAWGTTFLYLTLSTSNTGMNNETPGDPLANCNVGEWTGSLGPVRVGSYGIGVNTREATGSSYYGIMEMSGNVWERTVTVGQPEGRVFTGLHGDGILNSVYVPGLIKIGDANVPGWPDNSAVGSGFRGGAWYFPDPQSACISNRIYAASGQSFPLYDFGGRGVRTAPF